MKLGPKEIKVVNEYFVRPVKNRLKEIFMKKGLPQLRTADEIKQPPVRKDVEDIQAINEFNKRNPRADGGRMGFEYGGITKAFNELINEGNTTFKDRKELMNAIQKKTGKKPGGSFQASNSNYADLFKKITFTSPVVRSKQGDPEDYKLNETQKKDLTKKVNKLNKKYKLNKKGIKVALGTTQTGGNTTLQFQTNTNVYGDYFKNTLGISTKKSAPPNISGLNELEGYLKTITKSDLFKNYDKSAAMKAGGVKSAKKQLADIGSKKPDIFNYLLNNQNATIEQIAKDLKIKDSVVRTSLQGLYTDIYKRTADQGAVYLKDFNSGQLESVHGSIKNTKVRLKDRVKNLVIDAYKGDKNLKPLLEKLDNFYTLQSEIKKTPYGKFFAANLDHPVPLNFIRQLKEGADPFNLIKIKPVPEFLNQRAFKAQFDRVLGTAYRTGNKKALEAIVNVQSYLPQEFGGITPDGKIKDYGAKPFSLKTNLAQADFPEVYKRVFNFINNPELQETFKKSKVSFKNLASQEKNIMKQASEYKKQLKKLGEQGFQLSANPMFDPGFLKEAFKQLPTPLGAVGLNLGLGVDPTSAIDRASIAAEAAFAPQLVKQAAKLGSVGQRIANIGLSPAMAARAARIASPIGIASLAAEGLYQGGKFTKKRIEELRSMTPEQREELRRQGEAFAFDPFMAAEGGVASGPPPKSGPTPHGLPSLMKRGKKI